MMLVKEPGAGPSPIAFQLDSTSGVPTYLQLVHQVEQALSCGQLRRGDQLPRVRDVVEGIGINPNTVVKAYRELEHRGLAAGRPGQGTFVEADVPVVDVREQNALRWSLHRWLASALAAGLDEDAAVALFTSVIAEARTRIGRLA